MNKNKLLLSLASVLLLGASSSHADSVSISVGQPGFYGQINIGGYPAPQLLYPQPVIVQPAPYGAQPLYLYAPPRHVHNWKKYCRQYGACGSPVYFVQQRWYNQVYVPQYRREHGHGYERHDHDHDDRHGHGHGHGHGHRDHG
jgi:hypothetical protein